MRLSDFNLHDLGHSVQIVGALFADAEKLYLVRFPDEQDDREVEFLDMTLTEWRKFLRQTDLLEVVADVKDASGKIVKAVVRKSQRQINQRVSWEVFRRDGYQCRYCGISGVPMTVDHLVLWEHGGPSTEDNLVTACRKCNKTRGNTLYPDWLKHPYYVSQSKKLSSTVREDNERLVGTITNIPIRRHKRSR